MSRKKTKRNYHWSTHSSIHWHRRLEDAIARDKETTRQRYKKTMIKKRYLKLWCQCDLALLRCFLVLELVNCPTRWSLLFIFQHPNIKEIGYSNVLYWNMSYSYEHNACHRIVGPTRAALNLIWLNTVKLTSHLWNMCSTHCISAKFMQDIFWSRLWMRQLLMKPPAWTDDMAHTSLLGTPTYRVKRTAINKQPIESLTVSARKAVNREMQMRNLTLNEMIDQQFEDHTF